MTDEQKPQLKWFEVTWVTASGRTLVRAEDAGEAKMIASQNTEEAIRASKSGLDLPEGKFIAHEWFDVRLGPDLENVTNEPVIFDVEELAEDTAAELKREMEQG